MPEAARDNELVERYRRGEASAMETLLASWDLPVRRLVLRLGGPRCDADDMRQEVLLRVVRGAGTYRGDWAFSTWLHRIVLNVVRDDARRRKRRLGTSELTAEHPAIDAPTEPTERAEAARLVSAALAALPDELREPLVLRHYGDLTFQQAADALGLPASTVKSRVHAAMARLRMELAKRGLHEREMP